MVKSEQIEMFKKEFSDEIESKNVSVDDLQKCKISNSVLQAEVTLRKVFGDEIFVPKKTEEKLDGEKEVIKLSDEDIAFDSKVREICDNLDNSEFDSHVMVLLSKIEE